MKQVWQFRPADNGVPVYADRNALSKDGGEASNSGLRHEASPAAVAVDVTRCGASPVHLHDQ